MHINIHYRHITHSEDLSANIIKWFEQQLHVGSSRNTLKIDLFFSKNQPNSKESMLVFECHARARAPWLSKEVFLKLENEDFWKLVTECGYLLNKNMNRDIEFRRSKYRHKSNFRWQQKLADSA